MSDQNFKHPGEIMVHVTRGNVVESVHRGHLAVVDADGNLVASLGDPGTVTFTRSAAKPLQVMPFVMSDGADEFGFKETEIALACGSHGGEQMHVDTAAAMLRRIGLSKNDLHCGTHMPFNEEAANALREAGEEPTTLHNNCSGKHAAMLALAKHIGTSIHDYELPEHPVQKKILGLLSRMCDTPRDQIKIATDGCVAPNFAMPVLAMARGFVRLVSPPENFDEGLREGCQRVVAAMTAHPEMVGGTDRLDTVIMQTLPGQMISKIGAEGVWLAGILPSPRWKRGLGVALKIEDGNDNRARAVVALEVLRQLGVLNEADYWNLREQAPLEVKNRRGDVVGEVSAEFTLPV